MFLDFMVADDVKIFGSFLDEWAVDMGLFSRRRRSILNLSFAGTLLFFCDD